MISIFHFNILTGRVYCTSLDWFFAGQLKSINSVFISVQDCKDTHAGIFKYRCPQCEYKSNKYKQYTRHLKVHSSEKPFQCPICQHHSSTTSGLEWERIFKNGKTGISNFACCIWNLIVWLRTESSPKPDSLRVSSISACQDFANLTGARNSDSFGWLSLGQQVWWSLSQPSLRPWRGSDWQSSSVCSICCSHSYAVPGGAASAANLDSSFNSAIAKSLWLLFLRRSSWQQHCRILRRLPVVTEYISGKRLNRNWRAASLVLQAFLRSSVLFL